MANPPDKPDGYYWFKSEKGRWVIGYLTSGCVDPSRQWVGPFLETYELGPPVLFPGDVGSAWVRDERH